MWQVGPIISWLTQGLPTLSWPPTLEPFPPKLVPFWVLQEKQLQKIHPSTSLLLGWTHISPPVSGGPECPIPFLGRDLSLPLKSCSYCSSDRRCFTTLSWGQTIFISHEVKQPLSERGHLWISDQRILRYQVVLMENLGCTVSLCEVLNPATLLPTP